MFTAEIREKEHQEMDEIREAFRSGTHGVIWRQDSRSLSTQRRRRHHDTLECSREYDFQPAGRRIGCRKSRDD